MLKTRPTQMSCSLGVRYALEAALIQLPKCAVHGAKYKMASAPNQHAGRYAENFDGVRLRFQSDARLVGRGAVPSPHQFWMSWRMTSGTAGGRASFSMASASGIAFEFTGVLAVDIRNPF